MENPSPLQATDRLTATVAVAAEADAVVGNLSNLNNSHLPFHSLSHCRFATTTTEAQVATLQSFCHLL